MRGGVVPPRPAGTGSSAACPHQRRVPTPRERPIGELVKDLAGQTSTLVRQEIQLAQAELTAKGKVAGSGAGMLVGAAVAGAARPGRADRGPDRRARHRPAAVAGRADRDVAVGRRRGRARHCVAARTLEQATPPVPQTVETVKEDIQWAKTQTGSAGR